MMPYTYPSDYRPNPEDSVRDQALEQGVTEDTFSDGVPVAAYFNCSCGYRTEDPFTIEVINGLSEVCPVCGVQVTEDFFG